MPTLRSSVNPVQDYQSVKALKMIIDTVEPDQIHCHSSKAGLVGRIGARKFSIPVVYTVHGWGFGTGRKLHISALVRMNERALKSSTTAFIAVSECDRQMGIIHLGIPDSRIQTKRNGRSLSVSETHLFMQSK